MLRIAYFSFLLALASLPLLFLAHSYLRFSSVAFSFLTIALAAIAIARRD